MGPHTLWAGLLICSRKTAHTIRTGGGESNSTKVFIYVMPMSANLPALHFLADNVSHATTSHSTTDGLEARPVYSLMG